MFNENNNGGTDAQGAPPPTQTDKKKPERISFPRKVKIMYDAMCRMGIAQANAIYSVGEYFKSLDMALAKAKSDDKAQKPDSIKMQFSDKQIRIINVFLNEGYDAGEGADAEAISEHRQSRVAVNPKHIAEFAGTLGKPA